jgi:NTE family protein
MTQQHTPRIGLALGSGSARGWAHIGVIRALEEAGIRPHVVCGASIGALVGAFYAAGELDRFEQWVLGLRKRHVVALMDVCMSGGLLKGKRLIEFFRQHFSDRPIEQLNIPFAAVATALHTGAEIWLRSGSTLDAVRTSIAMPGLFAPVLRDGMVLVDGGLTNPVPVSLARAMGADILIGVDLGSDMIGRHLRADHPAAPRGGIVGDWMRKLRDNLAAPIAEHPPEQSRMPSVIEVLTSSINVMQVRLARSRMAGDPPDLLVAPRLAHLHLLDFHRAAEAIAEGRRAVERVAHGLSLFEREDVRASASSASGESPEQDSRED